MCIVSPAAKVKPGVSGWVKTSKPAVCARTLDAVVSAKRHTLKKDSMITETRKQLNDKEI
jgi:hypothetical protein